MSSIKLIITQTSTQSSDYPNITQLSNELLCHIIQFLPLRETLAIAMQCKKLESAVEMYFQLRKTLNFSQGKIFGYMPSSITDDHMHYLLRKCPRLETVYGLHPLNAERRRLRKRCALTVPGIIEALCLCPNLKGVETCDLRLLEAILQYLPQLEIIGHFRNRDGIFPPHASQRLKLQPYSQVASLHLIGVEIPELTAMPHLIHLSLQCVRFTKLQPFRAFLAQNLKTFIMKNCMGPAMALRYLSLIIALSSSPSLTRLELVRVPLPGGLFQRAVEDSHKHSGFVNLKILAISGCKGILETDIGYLMIVASKNLESVSIQPSLTKDSLFVSLLFARCDFSKLRNLNLGYADNFNSFSEWSSDALLTFGMADVPDVPSALTDSGMKVISELFPHVERLSICDCPHLMSLCGSSLQGRKLWKELKDLILERCYCLRLHSFALFLALLPCIETVLIKDMFKEPPKGCSHVGLSAGTGLGMSSAVVSNQDEHIAVQGHQQDLEPHEPLENEREYVEVEDGLYLQAENEDPELMALQEERFLHDNGPPAVDREFESIADRVPNSVLSKNCENKDLNKDLNKQGNCSRNREVVQCDCYTRPSTSKAADNFHCPHFPPEPSEMERQPTPPRPPTPPSPPPRQNNGSPPMDIINCFCVTNINIKKEVLDLSYESFYSSDHMYKNYIEQRHPPSSSDSEDEEQNAELLSGYLKRKREADASRSTCHLHNVRYPSKKRSCFAEEREKKSVLSKIPLYLANSSSSDEECSSPCKQNNNMIEKHLVFDPSLPSTSRDTCGSAAIDKEPLLYDPISFTVMGKNIKKEVLDMEEAAAMNCPQEVLKSEEAASIDFSFMPSTTGNNPFSSQSRSLKRRNDSDDDQPVSGEMALPFSNLKHSPSSEDLQEDIPSTPSYSGPLTRNMRKMQAAESTSSAQPKKVVTYKETKSYKYKNSSEIKRLTRDSSAGATEEDINSELYSTLFDGPLTRQREKMCTERSAAGTLTTTYEVVSQGTQATSSDIRRTLRRKNHPANPALRRAQRILDNSNPDNVAPVSRNKVSAKERTTKVLDPNTYSFDCQNKSTSTSDPLLEDDAVQTFRVVSESLFSLSLVSCGVSDIVVDHCSRLFHIEAQACRILKKVQLRYCPEITRLSISQCPKMEISELASEALTLRSGVLKNSVLVYYEPCMQDYNYADGEQAIFKAASLDQGIVLVHDFSCNLKEGIQATSMENLLNWLDVVRMILKVSQEPSENKEISDPLNTTFPWGHHFIRRLYGQMTAKSSTPLGSNFQILTNNPLFGTAFERSYEGEGVPSPQTEDYDINLTTTAKLMENDILEWKQSSLPWHKKLTAFYISVNETN